MSQATSTGLPHGISPHRDPELDCPHKSLRIPDSPFGLVGRNFRRYVIGLAPGTALQRASWNLNQACHGDLQSIIDHQASANPGGSARASEDHSLQGGTAAWGALGR